MTSSGRPHQKDGTPHVFDTTSSITNTAADAGAGVPRRQRPLGESGQKPLSMPGDTEDRPPQADLPEVLIADLPAEHALCSTDPAALGKPEKRKRLVFVGDVHGHLSALQALLKKINFDHRHGDHLVFVGDIVAKGPDSAGVVKLAMEVGASGVRGNHEDNVLLAHKDLLKKKKQHHKDTNLASEDLTLEEEEEEAEGETDSFTATRNKHADNARAVARSLSAKQIKWLSSLPIVLRIGQVTNSTSENIPWNAGEIAVVHAGLVPGLAFEDQDPWAMMNMRTLLYPALDAASDASSVEDIEEPDETIFPDETFSDDDSEGPATTTEDLLVAVPSDTRQGEPWSHAWNRYQNTAIPSPADRTIVIYGHDAKRGLQTNVEIKVQPHPSERRKHKKRKHPKRAENTNVEINIAPETEVEADGDVEVETEIEIEVEVEDNSGNGTASGDPSLPSDKKLKKSKRAQNTDINLQIATEVEVAVEVQTEIEIELEVEENSGNGTASGEASPPSDKIKRGEIDAERKKGKKHKKKKKQKHGKKGIRYAFGIDSGCGHGRQLTALVLETGPKSEDGVLHHIEQVDCGEVEK